MARILTGIASAEYAKIEQQADCMEQLNTAFRKLINSLDAGIVIEDSTSSRDKFIQEYLEQHGIKRETQE